MGHLLSRLLVDTTGTMNPKKLKTDHSSSSRINDKQVFYCRRYSIPYSGSYFEYRENKEICNPDDNYTFYMKIGGVVYLPPKAVPGKLVSSATERIKESAYFGSYVFYGNTDNKLRTLLYARRKGLPDGKLVSQTGIVHNIIPRYNGFKANAVITGMFIERLSNKNGRRWTKYDRHYPNPRAIHKGFHEFYSFESINLLDFGSKFCLYIPENTSALMVDITQPHLYNDLCRDYVYTVFQSGAFIITAEMNVWFCFYYEEEAEEYDAIRLLAEKRHLLDKSPNLDLLDTRPDGEKDRIVFLKSAPNHTFWTLRVNRERGKRDNNLQICVPTGGQFEDIMYFSEGIKEVKRRQLLKPWNKYIESKGKYNKSDNKLSPIDMSRTQAYPQTL